MSTEGFHFSDYFKVSQEVIAKYGAFNISLIRDLPLFIDPFLLFNSQDPTYQHLHHELIRYLRFLRDKSASQSLPEGLLSAWFYFPEVGQTWLDFSKSGNAGRGLGRKFASAMNRNLHHVFSDFGAERISQGTHFEKLTLLRKGVGRDMVSDFTTNLIKDFLCEYTQSFAATSIDQRFLESVPVRKARFNYETETWEDRTYRLPWHGDDYVLLTPIDILTRLDMWINRSDLVHSFKQIVQSISNEQMRAQINNYFERVLRKEPGKKALKKDTDEAVEYVLLQFPKLLDYYIRLKEDTGDDAVAYSQEKVEEIHRVFVDGVSSLADLLAKESSFFALPTNTYRECQKRIKYLKHVIEDRGGHRLFWSHGELIGKEADIQSLFDFVWYGTSSDVSKEVDDGKGPADYKVSKGSYDKTLVEFKVGSNRTLKRNLENQVETYMKASGAQKSIKVIVFFDRAQETRVRKILRELHVQDSPDVVLIDARNDNKPSGSKA